MNEFELIAKTFMGLEPVLAKELTQLGANNVQIGRRMVSFTGDKEMMYRANFQLHTAIRILKPIARFKARSADEVYEEVKKIDWSKYIEKGKTFSVDSVVYSEEFRNSRFVTYKVKDAIVDQFRENTGTRPNISVSNPDIRLNIHIAEADATLSLDSSGESLHRRGYRQESVEAPLNEVLAAGMILMTGWRGETDFIDPMCGSGTLLVEAALIAHNMSPGIFRKEFAFEKWPDFDAELFDAIYTEYMIKDWVNWKWLSGDHIVEQHVHNIDVFTWFSGLKPVKAVGFGSRHRRITGDQYDNFSVDFTMENGIHMHSMCRQIDGCANNVSEFIQGTKGSWSSDTMEIKDLAGNVIWKYDSEAEKANFKQTDPYTLEHVNWINCIRGGKQIEQASETAISNMAAIMGRESAYTGAETTWDAMTASALDYTPKDLNLGKMDMSGFVVPVPGKPIDKK